ncbi:hypothetical protein PspLS_08276, partial [Pyricularia sp. CBS 133598]
MRIAEMKWRNSKSKPRQDLVILPYSKAQAKNEAIAIVHADGIGFRTEPVNRAGLWKNTRDEIIWDNESMPWRRSPLWLLLRVTMHLVCFRQSPSDGLLIYKSFTLYLSARILRIAPGICPGSDYSEIMRLKVARRRLKLTSTQGSSSQFTLPEAVIKAIDGAVL